MGPSAPKSILDDLTAVAKPDVYARVAATWERGGADFGGDVRALAAALIGYGLPPGGRVAVLGSEGCDTLRAELAVLVSGGCLVSPEPAMNDATLSAAVAASGAVQAIASDERQLARLLTLRPDLPSLDLVLLMKARPSERKPAALLASAAIQFGAASLEAEPTLLREAASSGEASEAVVFYGERGLSETVGRGPLLALARSIGERLGSAGRRTVLSAIPCGSAARLATAMAVTSQGGTLLLADPRDRPDSGLVERPAHAVLLTSDGLMRLRRAWQEDMERRSWLGRSVTRWSLRQGGDPARTGWKRRLAEYLTLRDQRALLGDEVSRLDVVRFDPKDKDPDSDGFFGALGLPVRYLDGRVPASSGPVIADP